MVLKRTIRTFQKEERTIAKMQRGLSQEFKLKLNFFLIEGITNNLSRLKHMVCGVKWGGIKLDM
jgi:hypothetical protein